MNKRKIVTTTALTIVSTALIFTGITMLEQPEHRYHSIQMILSGLIIITLNIYLEVTDQNL